ncbi:MAG: ECF transporter S component [Acutalibacteraceae bacterium]|nr:ECF transporter S component [Oscillospiraceae bacterium]
MNSNKIKTLTTYSILIALMLVMAFTHLGYIKIGVAEITLMSIPVIIGIGFSGIKGGLLLGTVFGITSFIQCFGMSAFGAALLAINPVLAFILCLVPRILMGLLSGLIYEQMTKHNVNKGVCYITLSAASPLLNTLLFVPMLLAFFGRSEYIVSLSQSLGTANLFSFAVALFGLNALLELIVCVAIGPALLKALEKVRK